MSQNDQISTIHLGLFVLAGQIGLGNIALPVILAQRVGHDGWIPILIAGLLSLGITCLIILFLKRYRDRTIYEINRFLFGKWLGQLLNFLLLAYLLFLTGVGLRLFTEYIRLFHLAQIPPLIVTALIALPTIVLTQKGFWAIGRFSYFMIVILIASLLLAFTLLKNFHLSFLLPVGTTNWKMLSATIPIVFYAYIGLELPVFIYPAVKERSQTMRWVVIANVISLLFFELIYVFSVGIFGETMLKMTVAPIFSLSRYIQIQLIERVDLFFFLLWFPLLEATFRVYFAIAYDGTVKLFKFKKTNLSLALFTVVMVFCSLIPSNFNHVFRLERIVNYLGLAVIVYLMVCFLFSFVRKQGVTPQ